VDRGQDGRGRDGGSAGPGDRSLEAVPEDRSDGPGDRSLAAVPADRWWDAWPLLGLAVLLLFAFPYAERTRNASELPRLLQGMALVDSGSFAIDGPAARGLAPGPDVARGAAGGLYPNKPPGAGLVAAGAYVAARASAGEPLTLRRYAWWGRLVAGVLPTLLLCAALARRIGPALGARAAWLGIGLYVLATPAFAYAHLLYGHQLTACLLSVGALWLVEGLRGDLRVRAGLGGLLCGAAIGVEYSAAFAGLPLAVFVLAWARRGRWSGGDRGDRGRGGAARAVGLVSRGDLRRAAAHGLSQRDQSGVRGQARRGVPGAGGAELDGAAHAPAVERGRPACGGRRCRWRRSLACGTCPESQVTRRCAATRGCGWRSSRRSLLTCVSLNFEGGWRVGPRYLVAVMPALALGWAGAARWLLRAGPLVWIATTALVTWSAIINGLAASLWPHFDLTNIHQPVSEVLLPLWRAGPCARTRSRAG
jgi:hypothetical protein